VSTPAPTRGANSVPVAARQNYVHRKVNHIAVEEAQEAPNVVIAIFLISDTSTVSFLGGDMPARQLFPKVNLKIRGVDFIGNLIVLESKGIDVILGIE
jgi:hypothetical protein